MRREIRRSWDNSPDWGRPGTVLRTSQKMKGLLWACRRKGRRPSVVRVGREMEDTSMRTDSGEEDGAKVVVDYVDGGEVRVG